MRYGQLIMGPAGSGKVSLKINMQQVLCFNKVLNVSKFFSVHVLQYDSQTWRISGTKYSSG